jgi:hypothetical protein
LCPKEMEDREDPPCPHYDWLHNFVGCVGYRDFIRDNFGLYAPPADYAALRAENLRRTKAAEKKG